MFKLANTRPTLHEMFLTVLRINVLHYQPQTCIRMKYCCYDNFKAIFVEFCELFVTRP